MTDKIIIDGVDVAGCEFFDNQPEHFCNKDATEYGCGVCDYNHNCLYKRWLSYTPEEELTDKEFEEMKQLGGDLIIFLTHKDNEGIITPSESRKIYKCIEKLTMDYEIEQYHGQDSFNVLERLKEMFYHSWKKRRRVIFS